MRPFGCDSLNISKLYLPLISAAVPLDVPIIRIFAPASSCPELLVTLPEIVSTSNAVRLEKDNINEKLLDKYMSLGDLPSVDLCIRTGGEYRISNFLLWQIAYTEFYFTDCLWPDFTEEEMKKSLVCYCQRQRRYGLSSEQILEENPDIKYSKNEK